MTIAGLAAVAEALPISTAIAEGDWWFPILETVHVFAIALVVGCIMRVDFRLLLVGPRDLTVSETMQKFLPWTWSAFTVAAISGGLLFISRASKYLGNTAFQLKVLLLLLAGINMLAFHFITARTIRRWDGGNPPAAVKAAGAISVCLWVSIVAAGRWIGFL